jgi:hypothetical protein
MSNAINPEAGKPTGFQSYEQSDRSPAVSWGGTDSDGGPIPTPPTSASRVTAAGPAVSPNAGLQDYDTGDLVDSVEDEAEREG